MENEKFEDFMKNIPESYAVSREQIDREISSTETGSPESAEKLISAIEAVSNMPDSKEDQIRLLARINKIIPELRKLQISAGADPQLQPLIARLVHEQERINNLKDS